MSFEKKIFVLLRKECSIYSLIYDTKETERNGSGGVALVTPFNEDGSVDYNSLLRLVEYQIQNGIDFLCVLGTTAETPTLTSEEKQKIKQVVIERVNGRVPILLGVGSNCTQTVVDTLKNDDMTGVDAVLVAVPYYNKPSQEGLYQHYKAIAQATDLPIVLYNVPGRTGVNMTAETTLRLARVWHVILRTLWLSRKHRATLPKWTTLSKTNLPTSMSFREMTALRSRLSLSELWV